jgi:hypothetical protein
MLWKCSFSYRESNLGRPAPSLSLYPLSLLLISQNLKYKGNCQIYIIVSYLLKARTVEAEKQPLLANGSERTFISRQRPQNKARQTAVGR